MNSSLFLFATAVVAVVSGSAVYPVHHAPVTTQYHSQDALGQYAYGYSGGPSSKHEQRTADGLTSGGYSYVDANGLVQSLAYVSDPVNGFRVSGTNLPVDSNTAPHAVPVAHHAVPVVHHAEVPVVQRLVAAPAPYYLAAPAAPAPVATSYTSVVHHHEPAKAPAAVLAYAAPAPQVYAAQAPVISYAAPAPLPYAAPAPLAYAAPAPLAYAAPAPHVYAASPVAAIAPVKSQFHSQDEHGQYTYGYTDGASAKTESRYADGETRGSYSYVDDHGSVQSVHYSAGAEGFKAAGTNIPVHHV